ncbi:hypothetical protein EFJ84_00005, partial [Leuconostoc citreum]
MKNKTLGNKLFKSGKVLIAVAGVSVISAISTVSANTNKVTPVHTASNWRANDQTSVSNTATEQAAADKAAADKAAADNGSQMTTVPPVNPKDGDQFAGIDPVTKFSFGTLTYQASTGYWLDTYGNDRDPQNPQNIRHLAAEIAAAKAADEKAHEIVPGTDVTRPDDGDTNIGGASEVINGQTSVSSTATDQAAADKATADKAAAEKAAADKATADKAAADKAAADKAAA